MAIDEGLTRRAVILTAAALVLMTGCRSAKPKGPASMLNLGDPSTASQLLSGFHAAEGNGWRWTMKKFSVMLQPPPGSEEKGAILRLRMYVQDEHLAKYGPFNLSADVDGHALEPFAITKGGDIVYSKVVPAEFLKAPTVRVNFMLDKARPPDNLDGRELGVVVSLIGLQSR